MKKKMCGRGEGYSTVVGFFSCITSLEGKKKGQKRKSITDSEEEDNEENDLYPHSEHIYIYIYYFIFSCPVYSLI